MKIAINRMKWLCALLVISAGVAHAQSVSEIRNNKAYLCGEGYGNSLKSADNSALQDLISQISVSIESEFSSLEEEVINGKKIDSHSACKMVVNTYSQATLQNTQRVVIEDEPDAHVLRYVKRSDVDKIFASRRLKIQDMANNATKAVERGKIDDALRYYYWAYCLLQSLPNSNSVVDDKGHVLINWIPQQMNDVFSNITVSKVSEQDGMAELCIMHDGKPVTSMDYTYFDGMDWSNLYSAKDGRGIVELRPGMTADNLKLKCEYEYSGESHIDKEIADVVEVMAGRVFRKAYVMVEGKAKEAAPAKQQPQQPQQPRQQVNEPTISYLAASEEDPYRKAIEKVIAAVRNKDYASAESCFTEDGRDMYRRLISYGSARIVGEPSYSFYRMESGEVICRSVAMSFSFRNNSRKFVEDVTFTFTPKGKIDYLAFALDESSTSDILKHDAWSEYARKILTEFLENYKTAYALKRLDYIRSIFDDNAVIITGKVLTRPSTGEMGGEYLNNRYVQYTRQDKAQYMRKLEACFASNEYINIRFANNDIVKAGAGGEVYGIQIKQDYYSTNYGDTGYLFLMVDLNDPKKPIIKVRSWQPERDPNFGLIDLSHF